VNVLLKHSWRVALGSHDEMVVESEEREGGSQQMRVNILLAVINFGLGAWNLAHNHPFNTLAGAFAIAVGGWILGVGMGIKSREAS